MATVKWEKPPLGKYKVNWDVTIDDSQNCMGFGVLIRDHNGLVRAAKSMKVDGSKDPVVGEALAALAAVEFSMEQEIQDVILEGIPNRLCRLRRRWVPIGGIMGILWMILGPFSVHAEVGWFNTYAETLTGQHIALLKKA